MILVNKNTDVPVDLIHYGLAAIEQMQNGIAAYFLSDVQRFANLQFLLDTSAFYFSPQFPGRVFRIEQVKYLGKASKVSSAWLLYRIPNWDLRYNSKILLRDV